MKRLLDVDWETFSIFFIYYITQWFKTPHMVKYARVIIFLHSSYFTCTIKPLKNELQYPKSYSEWLYLNVPLPLWLNSSYSSCSRKKSTMWKVVGCCCSSLQLAVSCEKRERVTYFILLFCDLKIQIFDAKWLFFLIRCYYQIWGFGDI